VIAPPGLDANHKRTGENDALTVVIPATASVHVGTARAQRPLQPTNVLADRLGTAVSLTVVPSENANLHAPTPQLSAEPDGSTITLASVAAR
jgi:hypothetical protein